jgi:O-acetylhomoserine/O-acetylserine sulfhydrylase-like pyridoxal-dependent enzyme
MAIVQSMVSSFKQQILLGEHDLDTDVIKIALYTSAATLSAATTVYSTSDEVVGTGYTAGGNTLTGATVSLTGTTAFVDFSDTTWTTATITARGALMYNASKSNKAIAVLDFGADKTSTAGNFVVQFPANDSSSAIVRIA